MSRCSWEGPPSQRRLATGAFYTARVLSGKDLAVITTVDLSDLEPVGKR